jgi:flagellar biosynthesis protein FlhG
MGVWSLTRRIDDFLTKKVSTIDEVIMPTKYGPLLIGGGGGRLGGANIHFSHKFKLMRALKTIDADYVILDLGGDTTYNVLDFYLAADQGLVLTTCEPASYLDAYGFIKMSLHRKLVRLFGAESAYRKYYDADVKRIINEFIFSNMTTNGRHMSDLIERVKQEKPSHHGLIKDLLDGFRPATVVTMFDAQGQADELVARLKKVSGRMLAIDINNFGGVPFDRQIQQSANDLVPNVANDPKGPFAMALRRTVLKMEMA